MGCISECTGFNAARVEIFNVLIWCCSGNVAGELFCISPDQFHQNPQWWGSGTQCIRRAAMGEMHRGGTGSVSPLQNWGGIPLTSHLRVLASHHHHHHVPQCFLTWVFFTGKVKPESAKSLTLQVSKRKQILIAFKYFLVWTWKGFLGAKRKY